VLALDALLAAPHPALLAERAQPFDFRISGHKRFTPL
jgi:hypothetical protein